MNQETSDRETVIFMTAFDIHKFNKKIFKIRKKLKRKDLLQRFHIYGISSKEHIITSNNKIKYSAACDTLTQSTKFYFDIPAENDNEDIQNELDKMILNLRLHNSARMILDTTKTDISFCFNMESFLVKIKSQIFQVDPMAYMINGVLITNYILTHCETQKPLSIDEIYGRQNNYNIIPAEAVRYANDDDFVEDDRTISNIIFMNIVGFFEYTLKNKYEMNSFSFVHNILVFSNAIENTDAYFKNVLGADVLDLKINNIATESSFQYYSTEYLGLVNSYSNENFPNILSDIQILESLKIYLLLQMIIDAEVNDKLNIIINHQTILQFIHYQSHAPIITTKLIESVKSTISYNQYKEVIALKIEALKDMQRREQNKNSRLLNILLYFLALLGSFQTIQILQTEWGIPFTYGVIAVIIIFGVAGVVWMCREKH